MKGTGLAPYACDPARGRGRRQAEAADPERCDYQRDRDRIVHSSAFRRLVYKTQVFVNHEGDLFRTRLTHSLEVAQLARSMARSLCLNEDLTEAIALAHDLGHTPFGHAGQDTLNECMAAHGGFEHNLQSLRVVDWLERRYPDFHGLNLCFETREGILKHCSRRHAQELEAAEPGGVAARFLLGQQPSLEAQLCNLADELAYCAHDVDDGVRSGLLGLDQLLALSLVRRHHDAVLAEYPALQVELDLSDRLRPLAQEGFEPCLARVLPSVVELPTSLGRVVSYETGLRYRDGQRLEATAAAFHTDLSGVTLPELLWSVLPNPRRDDAAVLSERLGALYSETLGTVRPRIMVQGSALHLNQPRTVARIRTLLLAAVRAAVLWRQVGGTRWSLLLARGRIGAAARRLLAQSAAGGAA